MLKLASICKTFKHLTVLDQFSCTVSQGDFVVLMGPNGTGKSTLFDIIAGKTMPDSGSIYIDDIDITAQSEQKRATLISRLFQNTYLGSCSHLTIRENLSLATLKYRRAGLTCGIRSFPHDTVKEFLDPLKLNLEQFLDTPMGALSGGQRQIISFIMSVLHPPKVLLLDEPTAALDPHSATKLLQFANRYTQEHGIPTLLITHDPLIAKHLGNRLWILEHGKIKREYGPEKSAMNPQDFFHPIDYERLH